MEAVFNIDEKSIAAARARILQNRKRVPIIPANHSFEDDSDSDSSNDDDADCFVE
jgi:hypothetical protein